MRKTLYIFFNSEVYTFIISRECYFISEHQYKIVIAKGRWFSLHDRPRMQSFDVEYSDDSCTAIFSAFYESSFT